LTLSGFSYRFGWLKIIAEARHFLCVDKKQCEHKHAHTYIAVIITSNQGCTLKGVSNHLINESGNLASLYIEKKESAVTSTCIENVQMSE
jgi:hypothetical protein